MLYWVLQGGSNSSRYYSQLQDIFKLIADKNSSKKVPPLSFTPPAILLGDWDWDWGSPVMLGCRVRE